MFNKVYYHVAQFFPCPSMHLQSAVALFFQVELYFKVIEQLISHEVFRFFLSMKQLRLMSTIKAIKNFLYYANKSSNIISFEQNYINNLFHHFSLEIYLALLIVIKCDCR